MNKPNVTYRAVYDDKPRTIAEVDADRDATTAYISSFWRDGDQQLTVKYKTHAGVRFHRIKQVGSPRFRWPRVSVRRWSLYVAWRMTARYYAVNRPIPTNNKDR